MRSLEGMQVGNMVVNREIFQRQLNRVPGLTPEDVSRILNPDDSQDVPRAIDFVNTVNAVAHLPDDAGHLNPGEDVEARVVGVIGTMFAAFTHAYIVPELCLTDQVVLLSKYAHLAFALFRAHRVNFMPYQLYGDTQTTVKNVIICIAKQQDLDATVPFYLFKQGDDNLEELFGIVRELGGHNPNVSFKQLCERLGAAVDIASVFSRHPELDPGHRRLKVTRTEHADHLNPESWVGNVTAGSVDLPTAWATGREAASAILSTLNITVDFTDIFDDARVVDMLKPFGDGKYPGVSTEYDRSLEPTENVPPSSVPVATASNSDLHAGEPNSSLSRPTTASSASPQTGTSTTPPPSNLADHLAPAVIALDDEELDNLAMSSLRPTFDDEMDILFSEPSGLANLSTAYNTTVPNPDTLPSVLPASSELDDVMEDPPSLKLPTMPSFMNTSAWLIHLGKHIHKASLCRLVITPDYIRKSHKRVFRVRGFTSDHKFINLNSDNLMDEDAFIVGDLFAAFISCGNQLFLAVFKSIVIEEKSRRVDRVRLKSLPYDVSGIRLTGQILQLQEFSTTAMSYVYTEHLKDASVASFDPVNPSFKAGISMGGQPTAATADIFGSEATPGLAWLWTGEFVKLDLDQAGGSSMTGKAARKTITVKIASHVCEPINPKVVVVRQEQRPLLPYLPSSGITWGMAMSELELLIAKLWDNVKLNKALALIPSFRSNTAFPYIDSSGMCTQLLNLTRGISH